MRIWVGAGQHTPGPLVPLENVLLDLPLTGPLPLVGSPRSLLALRLLGGTLGNVTQSALRSVPLSVAMVGRNYTGPELVVGQGRWPVGTGNREKDGPWSRQPWRL